MNKYKFQFLAIATLFIISCNNNENKVAENQESNIESNTNTTENTEVKDTSVKEEATPISNEKVNVASYYGEKNGKEVTLNMLDNNKYNTYIVKGTTEISDNGVVELGEEIKLKGEKETLKIRKKSDQEYSLLDEKGKEEMILTEVK